MKRWKKKRKVEYPAETAGNLARSRIHTAMKQQKLSTTDRVHWPTPQNDNQMMADTGATMNEYMNHLQQQFAPWMTWANHGNLAIEEYRNNTWEADHIQPIGGFDLSIPIEFKKAFHFTNVSPMRKSDNSSKGTDRLQARERVWYNDEGRWGAVDDATPEVRGRMTQTYQSRRLATEVSKNVCHKCKGKFVDGGSSSSRQAECGCYHFEC